MRRRSLPRAAIVSVALRMLMCRDGEDPQHLNRRDLPKGQLLRRPNESLRVREEGVRGKESPFAEQLEDSTVLEIRNVVPEAIPGEGS